MSFVLVVSSDPKQGKALRGMLTAQGWWVNVVASREGALQAAADTEPRVAVVDERVAGAEGLVKIFSSRNGGPGAVALTSLDQQVDSLALVEAGADELLSAEPKAEEFVGAVKRVSAIPHRSAARTAIATGRSLTANELFGDILLELEGGSVVEERARAVASASSPSVPGVRGNAGLRLAGSEPGERSPDVESVSMGASAGRERSSSEGPESETGGLPWETDLVVGRSAGGGLDDLDDSAFGGPPPLRGLDSPSVQPATGALRDGPSVAVVAEVESTDEGASGFEGPPAAPESGRRELGGCGPSTPDGSNGAERPLANVDAPPYAESSAPSGTPSSFADRVEEPRRADTPPDETTGGSSGAMDRSRTGPETSQPTSASESGKKPQPAGERSDLADVDSLSGRSTAWGSRNFGQYCLEERIAVGGMAEVWRASMVGLEGFEKTVAIKKILPHLAENAEFVTMFVDEAKLAARLSHENLVDIYDLGMIDDDYFIAMEFVDGKDLRRILDRLRRRAVRLPLGFAFFVASRIAAALDYAHTRHDSVGAPLGLVHRDVSPRNILISSSGNIRLCDFGIAKAVSSVSRTKIGQLKGKIQYMSPEQARGSQVDARSDLFSLGSVLFEMVTGRRLFDEDSDISLLDAVRSGNIEEESRALLSSLPDDARMVVERSLEKLPDDRYESAHAMLIDLEEVVYQLEPKPTQGALAEWLEELFTEREETETRVDREVPRKHFDSTDSAPAEVSASSPLAPMTGSEDKPAAPGSPGVPRGRFWMGVAAGLVAAALAALGLSVVL